MVYKKGHEKLRERMRRRGVNIKRLSEVLGVSDSTLSKKLRKTHTFAWWEVVKICEFLELKNPFNWFEV